MIAIDSLSNVKRKIYDCYNQGAGWGNLHFGPLGDIAERADILSLDPLYHDMMGMHREIH